MKIMFSGYRAKRKFILSQTGKFGTLNLQTSRKSNLELTESGIGLLSLNQTFQDKTWNLFF